QRAGGEPEGVPGRGALPRTARRAARAGRAERPSRARSTRAVVPAEAPLAVGLPPACDELRRVRRRGWADRVLAAGRRGRVPRLRGRDNALARAGGAAWDRGAAQPPARGRRRRGADRASGARRPCGDHVLVRVPRRLSPAYVRMIGRRVVIGAPGLLPATSLRREPARVGARTATKLGRRG